MLATFAEETTGFFRAFKAPQRNRAVGRGAYAPFVWRADGAKLTGGGKPLLCGRI